MTVEPEAPFERDVTVDDPGIIGARWWNRSLVDVHADMGRRDALKALTVLTVAGVVVGGVAVAVAVTSDDTETQSTRALDAQRRFGWNLGARDQRLTFPVVTLHEPFDTAALARDLTPVAWRHVYQSALLDAPDAMPRENPSEETVSFRPLREELVAGLPQGVERLFLVGNALARMFLGRDARTALVLDLAGPESVALAAGAAAVFEPVLAIGNWPHPRGVVDSHITLATALKCHRYFHDGRAARAPNPPPCFVLDRNRLARSVGDDRFDNRYLAALPSAATLRAGGIERLLYVVPFGDGLPELDDLNEDFAAYVSAGLEVRALAAGAFTPVVDGTYVYGGTPEAEAGFWLTYPWSPAPPNAALAAVDGRPAQYRPARRVTTFSRASSPAGFGTVALVVSGAVVLGAAFDRRGSWHRTGSSWGGG